MKICLIDDRFEQTPGAYKQLIPSMWYLLCECNLFMHGHKVTHYRGGPATIAVKTKHLIIENLLFAIYCVFFKHNSVYVPSTAPCKPEPAIYAANNCLIHVVNYAL